MTLIEDEHEEAPLLGNESPLLPTKEESCSGGCQFAYEKRGRTFICCRSRRTGKPLCVIGPHWAYLLLTYAVIIGASTAVFYLLITREALIEFTIFGMCLTALVLGSLTALAFVDPGIVQGYNTRKETVPEERWSFCDRCATFRPPKAIHCNECQVCIEQYDHHCPWTGKCVGRRNVHYFHIFVTAVIFTVIYDVVLTAIVLLTDAES